MSSELLKLIEQLMSQGYPYASAALIAGNHLGRKKSKEKGAKEDERGILQSPEEQKKDKMVKTKKGKRSGKG